MDNWGTRLARLLFRPTKNNEVVSIALSLMPSEVEQKALAEYLREHRALSAKLRLHTYLLNEPQEAVRRWHISNLFVNYGTLLADNIDFSSASSSFRDFDAAAGSFLYALIFYQNNPLAWACNAELYMRWEDQIAGQWAKKLLSFKPNKSTLELLNKVFPEGVYPAMMTDLRARMRIVIKICSEHPEWRDSYSLKRGTTFYQDLLG